MKKITTSIISILLGLSVASYGADSVDVESACESITAASRDLDQLSDVLLRFNTTGADLRKAISICDARSGLAWMNICGGGDCGSYYGTNRNLHRLNLGRQSEGLCHSLYYNYCGQKGVSCQLKEEDFDFIDSPEELPPSCQVEYAKWRDSRQTSEVTPGNIARLEQLTSECESTSSTIRTVCSNTPDDMSSTLRVLSDQASRMVSQSALDQCSRAAQVASATQSALSSVKIACGSSYDTCRSRCEQASNELRRIQSQVSQDASLRSSNLGIETQLAEYQNRIRSGNAECSAAQAHIRTIDQNLATITSTMEKSSQCAASLAADGQAPPTYDQCIQDPNRKGCELFKGIVSTNCNDPQFAATNPICICQKNPNAPQCGGINQKNNNSLISNGVFEDVGSQETAASSSSGGSSPFGGSFGGGEEFEANQRGLGGVESPSTSSAAGGGVYGGLRAQGRPLNEPYKKPVMQVAPSRLNANVIGRGGGGGGGFLSTLRSALGLGNTSSKQDLSTVTSVSGDKRHNNIPDLTQFLPGGMRDPRRRLSSTFGPDGITGPYSDNFKKVNVRYISLGQTFK